MNTEKQKKVKKPELLLLDDVDGLGRSGDVVSAKPGFVRNYLLPQKKAVVANKATLTLQASLKVEREKRALVDKKEAEEQAKKLEALVLEATVKVDQEGKMYGSVNNFDIAQLLLKKGYEIKRQNILLLQPIKSLGRHSVNLKLKEGVIAKVSIEVVKEEAPEETRTV